jgi:quinol monooxygenase YgiN
MYADATGVKRSVRCRISEVTRKAKGRMQSAAGARPGKGVAAQEEERVEFVVIAQYRVRSGEEDKVAAALRHMVAPTRAEPGNLDYQIFRDPADPALFVLFERYADAAAFEEHKASEHFATWLAGQVLPSLDNRVRLDLVPLGE